MSANDHMLPNMMHILAELDGTQRKIHLKQHYYHLKRKKYMFLTRETADTVLLVQHAQQANSCWGPKKQLAALYRGVFAAPKWAMRAAPQ